MSDALVTVPAPGGLAMRGKYATDVAKTEAASSSFLPYILLMGSSSTKVKEGKFPVGKFALVRGQNYEDIGSSILAVPLSWRPKASDFTDGIANYFDMDGADFKRIKQLADTPSARNYAYGIEFLLYLPVVDVVGTFMFGNKSSRNEAPNLLAILETQTERYKIAKINSALVGKKDKWHVPQVEETDDEVTKFPPLDVLQPIVDTFNNPVEAAKTVEADTRSR